MVHSEKTITVASGWIYIFWTFLMAVATVGLFVLFIRTVDGDHPSKIPMAFACIFGASLGVILFVSMCMGFFYNAPNMARVLTLFGNYVGTVRNSGLYWTNPFNQKQMISLRSRTLMGDQLKVNDKRGNPVEIAAVIVWQVADTAQAMFDVENYERFVQLQTETALRHLASEYPYDPAEDSQEVSLRSSVDEVSHVLAKELQQRVTMAGVLVQDCRITHLAYAPEIAGAMLRRQQAEAIIDARQKIVHGAVSMVQMALRELAEKDIVQLDEERKAHMVGNLLVILCGETAAQPVINSGTLYS